MSGWIHAEQAIFTSLERREHTGYHLVSRSRGIHDDAAAAIARWSAAHGALEADEQNQASLQFFPVSPERYALARTCAGPPEYSGRGGEQLYTHLLVFDPRAFGPGEDQIVALYRIALAIGLWCYRQDPPRNLEAVKLPRPRAPLSPHDVRARASELGLAHPEPLLEDLARGEAVQIVSPADRIELLECVLRMRSREDSDILSCATSLKPSACRPYRLLITH